MMIRNKRKTKTIAKMCKKINNYSRIWHLALIVLVSFFLSLWITKASIIAGVSKDIPKPEISDQVVFFYYNNLKEAAHFYESIMGFKQIEQTFFLEWVEIYGATANSFIGIVDEKRGTLKSSRDKPVMLSWVTNDVDGWYQYLKEKGVSIIQGPKTSQETGTRGMTFRDPGGYILELFQWINR